MKEVSNVTDVNEHKPTETEGYQKIKPENETSENAEDFWNRTFEPKVQRQRQETGDKEKQKRKSSTEELDNRKETKEENQATDNKEGSTEAEDGEEVQEKKGGRYADVKKDSDGSTHEVHHMPADNASNLERDDGPAIRMEKEDHRKTASCGNSREAREYREKQRKLIEEGKFREALQMDIDDIHEKFGDKYDEEIAEMLEYVDELEKEGKING